MSFGLGYFQDGVWIDHLAADDATSQETAGLAADDLSAIDAIHQLFSCCPDPVDDQPPVGEREDAVPGMPFRAVAGTAQG